MISDMLKLVETLMKIYDEVKGNVPDNVQRLIEQQNVVITTLINKVNNLTLENNRLKKFERENYNNNEVRL